MMTLLVLAGMLGAAFGQPAATSLIEGTVQERQTGAAIPNMLVQLTECTAQEQRADAAGRFAFKGVFLGSCRIVSDKQNGYLRAGQTVVVGPGQQMTDVHLLLQRTATLGGRVLDGEKNPVVGVRVELRSMGYRNARPMLFSFRLAETDDTGEYRFSDISPGRYLLYVVPRFRQFYAVPSPHPDETEQEPISSAAISYYGNSLSAETALPVVVKPGDLQEHLDLSVLRAPGVCVSTSLDGPARVEDWIGVAMTDAHAGSQTRVASGRLRNWATVEVCGITPGHYRLLAFAGDSRGGPLIAEQHFHVSGGRTVRLPATHLEPLRPVTGRVRVAEQTLTRKEEPPTGPPRVNVEISPKFRGRWLGETLEGASTESGEFVVPAASVDEYWVAVTGLPARYYVRRVEVAGQDVYGKGFWHGGQPLDIVLGADGPALSGQVLDGEKHPQSNAVVTLVAAEAGADVAPGQVMTAQTGPDGRFTFTGMGPGDYDLAAFTGVPLELRDSPEAIRAVRQAGVRLTLSSNAQITTTVEVREFPVQ